MLLLNRFKISGHSMEPNLKFGDEVLVSGVPYLFKEPAIGEVVVFKSSGKFILKRIKERKGESFLVKGDNATDSKEFGWIKRSEILGKVIN